jgi:hypothetical protein
LKKDYCIISRPKDVLIYHIQVNIDHMKIFNAKAFALNKININLLPSVVDGNGTILC